MTLETAAGIDVIEHHPSAIDQARRPDRRQYGVDEIRENDIYLVIEGIANAASKTHSL
jgi:hypothetical protein